MRLAIAVFLIIFSIFFFRQKNLRIISPIADGPSTKILGIFTVKKNPEALREKVEAAIGNSWNNYSVYVADLNSTFTMGINQQEMFTAASVNKLPILAVLYDQAQKGKLDLDRTITLQKEDIQDYGTGSIRYDPPGTVYSVKTLVRLMMQKSDNTAAFLLGNYVVGLDTVQSVINNWGMMQTDMVNNKTSNADIALLLAKIYRGNVANPAATTEMLGFMQGSDFEDRLPGLLPKDTIVYHKIGSGDTGEVHDVGLVVGGNTKYYVGILTTNVPDPDSAPILIAKVSKIIYDFME